MPDSPRTPQEALAQAIWHVGPHMPGTLPVETSAIGYAAALEAALAEGWYLDDGRLADAMLGAGVIEERRRITAIIASGDCTDMDGRLDESALLRAIAKVRS